MAKILRAIKPNAGIRAKYRKRMVSLLDEMQRSVVWWLRAEYRKQETRIAQDASCKTASSTCSGTGRSGGGKARRFSRGSSWAVRGGARKPG